MDVEGITKEITGYLCLMGVSEKDGEIKSYIFSLSHWLNDGIIKGNEVAFIYSTGIY